MENLFDIAQIFNDVFLGFIELFVSLPDDLSDRDIGEGRAITITFTLGIFTAALSYIFSKRRDKNILTNVNSMAHYEKHSFELDEAFKVIENYMYRSSVGRSALSHEEVAREQRYLEMVLNHYEIVAVGISGGYLSERHIRRAERTRIIRTFIIFSPHIRRLRDYTRNPYALSQYEKLFLRTWSGTLRHVVKPIEFLLDRPLFSISRFFFVIEYFAYSSVLNLLFPSTELSKKLPSDYLLCDWGFVRSCFRWMRYSFLIIIAYILTIIAKI